MPTPFTHLEVAQRLLRDEKIPQHMRDFLHDNLAAFTLGSVAADGRVGSGAPRETTHFYAYGEPLVEHPWRVMVRENPRLMRPHSDAHRAFVAAYVAHLSMDEIWSKHMVGPHFVGAGWGDQRFRFYMLHIILIYMDERDLAKLEDWIPESLCAAMPESWLGFMSDDDLRSWQTLIHDQIKPDGHSQTLEIFGERIGKPPEEMRAILDDPNTMQSDLWDHVSKALLGEVEAQLYAHARQQLIMYLQETT